MREFNSVRLDTPNEKQTILYSRKCFPLSFEFLVVVGGRGD